ncbi:MAG: hypothetical protein QW687_00830 [Candidatus Hadarchaeales archaeon]
MFDDKMEGDCLGPHLKAPQAPIPISVDRQEGCWPKALKVFFGGARDEAIWIDCSAYFPQTNYGIYYNPHECFIAMPIRDTEINDKFISALIVSVNLSARLLRECPGGVCHEWPDFFAPVFAPLGNVSRTGDRWHWDNPFVEVVRAK